ncbi:MAG: ABC transporter permease [Aureliella sp.]
MRFSSLIIKNLLRRPARSLLTLVALMTAIAAVIGLNGISRGFTQSFADIYEAHSVDIVVSRQGSADRLSSSVDQDFVDGIGALPEVERTAGVLLDTLSFEDEGVYGVPTMGVAADSWLLDDYDIEGQNDFAENGFDINSATKQASKQAFLGIHLAERLELEVGGTFNLFDEPYRVSGIFTSPSTWENGSMIMPLSELQQLTDRVGQVTYVNVVLAKPVSDGGAETAIQEIQALDARLLALATGEFVETDTRMQLAGAMAFMTSAVALVIGAIGTLNTMLTSVLERTREIGILRAIGWPRGRIVKMILLESCTLAVVASALGSLLAVVMTWSLAQAPAAKGILSPSIDLVAVAQGVALAIGIGLLGAILPAWRAAQMLPTEAFREQG